MERTKANQNTQNIILVLESPKKYEANHIEIPQKGKAQKKQQKLICQRVGYLSLFHPPNLIIGKTTSGVKTIASLYKEKRMMALFSTIKPKNIDEVMSENS